jgi:LysR family transcriptional activator of dmlA
MGIARSAASRRLSDLEARIGVTLIERTTRRFELTTAGHLYLERARGLLAAVDDLDGGFVGALGASAISVSADDPLAVVAVLPAIATFLEANPNAAVTFTVEATCSADSDVRLSIGGDGPAVGSALRALCASPAYLTRRGRPTAASLDGHIAISTPDDAQRWRTATGNARPTVALAATDEATALAAALLGIGLAVLPEAALAIHVDRGELEILLTGELPPARTVHATVGAEAKPAATLLVDSLAKPRK